jgi:uncharacterized membrane protein
MSAHISSPAEPPAATPNESTKSNLSPIDQNIENILAIYLREERNLTRSQRILENISETLGRPFCFGAIAVFVAFWILVNMIGKKFGLTPFDPPPFFWLQGMIGLASLLTMIVILIKQNRLAKLEERREHLELQVNLLTEQKTTKLINLMEELRHDLPMIRDRHDPEATAYQQPTNPQTVLAALDERLETGGRTPEGHEMEGI